MAIIREGAQLGDKELTIEHGRMAPQAGGSVVISYGDSQVLCTASDGGEKPHLPFFPLLCDYVENFWAAGKIPGGFFKREGKPSEKATLTSRLIDRPHRPLFPEGYRRDTQLVAWVISADQINDTDVLAVQVAPMVGLRVERDEADNFYVVPASDGLLRVNMKIAAPRVYFNGEFSEAITWRDFTQVPQHRDTRLTRPIQSVAANVLKLNGASTRMVPRDALYALIEYYRDFEARPFPEELAKDDLYSAISQAQVGVCRHRSLAFVISARALGIPARYIYNEAHAFVEIYWPKMGWRRIDLGGAAEQLDYAGRRGGGVHQASPDALPQPPNYISELERMGADIPGYNDDTDSGGDAASSQADGGVETDGREASGDGTQAESDGAGERLSDAQLAATGEGEASEPEEDPAASASQDSSSQDDTLEADFEMAEESSDDAREAEGEGETSERSQEDESTQTQPASEAEEPEVDERRAVRIDVVASNPEIFRGTALDLNGSIFSVQGRAISRATLKVYLGPVGAESTDGLVLLGEVESDAGGRFAGQFLIPNDISIGRWSVVLRYEGDDKYLPAQVD